MFFANFSCQMDHHTFHAVIYRNPFYVAAPQAPPANAAYYYPQPQQQQQQQVTVMYQYPRMEVAGQDKMMTRAAAQQQQQHNGAGQQPGRAGHPSRETLQLFPLQPTFVLRHDKGRAANGSNNDSLTSTSTATATATATASASISEDSDGLESGSSGKGVEEAPALPFYDFFGLQSSGGR